MKYAVVMVLGFLTVVATYSYGFAYQVPDSEGAKMILEERQVVSGKGHPAEILIRTFKRAGGTMFRDYSVKGRVFRYDVDEDGAQPYEYRLLDKDGDGEFETREKMVGETGGTNGPEKYFIDIGPEPGKEYHYRYMDEARPLTPHEENDVIDGYPIYIPQWVLVEF
ncbi:MAG TPA: hypothetical protein VGB23_04000 [Nitrospirota bacterium]